MNCFVCNGKMNEFCEKKFDFRGFKLNQYVKCEKCGMVVSKTFYEMSHERWVELNNEGHKTYQGSDENEVDPRWIERLTTQKEVLKAIFKNEILSDDLSCVDYGCGDGKLADYFNNETVFNTKIMKYDKYMSFVHGEKDYLKDEELHSKKWDIVINCSVLEHIIGKNDLDEIMNLIDEKNGIMCLHTLVCEEVPCEPEWFYFLLGHCTIWTNKAMASIFDQYGFRACAYNVESRLWFMFKNEAVIKKFEEKQECLPGKWVFSDKFVDYWKQKPYR